jgi:hypothetical protein
LREVLEEGGIPHHSVFRRDHLFNLKNFPAYEIGVPFSLFQKAENVVRDAFGTVAEDAVKLLKAPRPAGSDLGTIRKLLSCLTPGAAENIPGPTSAGKDQEWCPEGAGEPVWAGGDAVSADFLVAALLENGIRCRVDRNETRTELFVLSKDEARAREIVREVVEGKPPG